MKRLGLPELSNCATLQPMSQAVDKISSGNVPVILLFSRYLRRRGSVARRAGQHRGRGGNSQGRQRREQADRGRDRAGDLVVGEPPATPRGGRAARRASGTRGDRRYVSAVSWPISGGIGPSILLPSRDLRRRGSVARRAGRRGRGGNSQDRQRRELADLGRERADDLVVGEPPATPRGGRAPRRASGTRGELAGTSAA